MTLNQHKLNGQTFWFRLFTTDEKIRATSAECGVEEQKAAVARQQQLQEQQLLQAEKMSSLGRMLAGVAHRSPNSKNRVSSSVNYARFDIDVWCEFLSKQA